MNRILVVNVNWLGDVIFSSPVFKALKKAYPHSEISCLAVPRVRDILECIPQVDRILIYDERGRDRSPVAKMNLIGKIRRARFDAAFILHRSLTRALLTALAGIPVRVGYDEKGRGFLLTHPLKPVPCPIHRSDHYLRVVESFGIRVEDRTCELHPPAEAFGRIEELLRQQGIGPQEAFVVVNPGGNWDLKRWPKEHYVRLIGAIQKQWHCRVVITGSPEDVGLAQEVASRATDSVVLAGRTNLKELMALMKKARLVISADSGPLHLAGSVGAKVVGIFGPTRPEITGPRGTGAFAVLSKDVGCNREALSSELSGQYLHAQHFRGGSS